MQVFSHKNVTVGTEVETVYTQVQIVAAALRWSSGAVLLVFCMDPVSVVGVMAPCQRYIPSVLDGRKNP